MKVSTIIKRMLKENTGIHMMDSGGAYSRGWQRNQGVRFEDTPESTFSLLGGVVLNIYHFLVYWLERDERAILLERELYRLSKLKRNQDESWFAIVYEFVQDHLGIAEPRIANTYNWENNLSQVMQYVVLTDELMDEDGEVYIILQIHGGCDVRGGYTAPRVFKVRDYYNFLSGMSYVVASCSCEGVYTMSSNCGYDWDPLYGQNIPVDNRGFPKQWKGNEEIDQYVCEKCGQVVSIVADYASE